MTIRSQRPFSADFALIGMILRGGDLTNSRRDRATRVRGDILGVCRDPSFVSKMRNAVQRASKVLRVGQIGVFNTIGESAPN